MLRRLRPRWPDRPPPAPYSPRSTVMSDVTPPVDPTGGGLSADDIAAAKRVQEAHRILRAELGKTIVGLDQVIDQLLISIFARGHCLLVGVPGLAKTLLISTVARCLSLSFNRIQFTPDLMPADITGTEVIQEDRATGQREFKFIKGPIFANTFFLKKKKEIAREKAKC